MVMETISVGFGGLKTAIDTVKGINSTINAVAIAEAKALIISSLIDAQHGLLDAQRELLENTDTIRALEAKIVQLEDWSAEAERYELADTRQGALAYRLKGTEPNGDSGEWLCPNCFANGKKSHLIPERHFPGRVHVLRCHPCGLELITQGHREIAVPSGRRR